MTKQQKRYGRTATAYARLAAKAWRAGDWRAFERYTAKVAAYRRKASA